MHKQTHLIYLYNYSKYLVSPSGEESSYSGVHVNKKYRIRFYKYHFK